METENKGNFEDNPEVETFYFEADSEEEAKALAFSFMQQKIANEKEEVVRPKITFRQVFNGTIAPLILMAVNLTLYFTVLELLWGVITNSVIIFIVFIKPFFVLLVLLYQKFAPASVRGACLFTPSCSEYMLLAIEKYGFLIGFFKGIRRILRCHPPHGGEDYP